MSPLIDRKHSFVNRWHHRPDMGQSENLAEHMGWVARISMLIGNEIESYQKGLIDWKLLYEMALQHDDAELITGDIPSPAKTLFDVDKVEITLANQIYEDYPVGNYAATFRLQFGRRPEALIVRAADKVAAFAYALMQVKMGNTYFRSIIEPMKKVAIETLQKVPYTEDFVIAIEAEAY